MWGRLAAEHRGHTLRAGTLIVQAEARRLRLFALEVFFLGTAIASLPELRRYQLEQGARPAGSRRRREPKRVAVLAAGLPIQSKRS
jgi:hypothetical protein